MWTVEPVSKKFKNFTSLAKTGWMSRTGKNELILTCPCAKRLHSARLKNGKTGCYRPQILNKGYQERQRVFRKKTNRWRNNGDSWSSIERVPFSTWKKLGWPFSNKLRVHLKIKLSIITLFYMLVMLEQKNVNRWRMILVAKMRNYIKKTIETCNSFTAASTNYKSQMPFTKKY